MSSLAGSGLWLTLGFDSGAVVAPCNSCIVKWA